MRASKNSREKSKKEEQGVSLLECFGMRANECFHCIIFDFVPSLGYLAQCAKILIARTHYRRFTKSPSN
jgi:hypothetical protein